MPLKVSSLNIYPIKSSAGISLTQAKVDELGLAFDRRFVVSCPEGQFITGRTAPTLCLIHIEITDDGILVQAPKMPPLTLRYADFSDHYQFVNVWGDEVSAQHCSKQASAWFSQYLQRPCSLLFFGEHSRRNKHENTSRSRSLAFADGYPLLLISQGALNDLNKRLTTQGLDTVSMQHFRPNIVVDFETLSSEAPFTEAQGQEEHGFIEDSWQHIQIGEVEFKVSKPCERCIFTTVDPLTAIKNVQQQPLKTLQKFRKISSGEVLFGQNLVPLTHGEIFTGDKITVLNKQKPPIFIGFTSPKNNLLAEKERKPMLTCNKIIDETHDVKTFVFNISSPRHYLAGQHIVFSVDINGQEKICCYTLSSSPTDLTFISITIKRVDGGVVSNFFHDSFHVGDSIKAKAPNGKFHLPLHTPKSILLLSAGSGITPMLSMLKFLVNQKSQHANNDKQEKIVFVHSAKTERDIIAKSEIESLAKRHGNCEIIYVLSQQTNSAILRSPMLNICYGRLSQEMLTGIEQIAHFDVFVCGPSDFRKSAQQYLRNLGVSRNNYHYESFGERKAVAPSISKVNDEIKLAPATQKTNPPQPIHIAEPVTPPEKPEPENVAMSSQSTALKVTFEKWNKTFESDSPTSDSPQTILEQGEAAGLILPYSCRAGMCGDCKAKLINGEVEQLATDGLSQEDITQGYILCCSAIAKESVTVEHD